MDEATTYIILMGHTFEVTIYFDVTDYGAAPVIDYNHGGDAGWGPEWDVGSIFLREDRVDWDEEFGPSFEATGQFLETLCRSRKIQDAILDAIANQEMDRHCRRLRRYAV